MERLFFECTVRAALLVGATAIVLYAMRVKAAAARHGIWTGVMVLMLVLPIWTVGGPRVSLRVLTPLPQTASNEPMILAGSLSDSVLPLHLITISQAVLLGVYLLGLCVLLLRLAIGTVRAHRLVRKAASHHGVRTSSLCAAPVTVGFIHPTVILPAQWKQWSLAKLDAVLTHEHEHARRRDSLIQWLALLNRALFWFHPVAWWLERHLSGLAEEACDDVVLAHGHNAHEYSEYLIEMARSVANSGARLNISGMTMTGGTLPRRIRRIHEGGPASQISRARMLCVGVACAITCTAFASGSLDHAQPESFEQNAILKRQAASSARPTTKFVLGDVRIEGDVHDRAGVRARILKTWKDREYGDDEKLAADVMKVGIRGDFQERGYFKVLAHDPTSQTLGITNGKQHILIVTFIEEGDQFRLGTITIQNIAADRALNIPVATLRDQFHLRDGDLFDVTEIRAGLERLKPLYGSRGYADIKAEPDTEVDFVSHRINFILRITEGPHKP